MDITLHYIHGDCQSCFCSRKKDKNEWKAKKKEKKRERNNVVHVHDYHTNITIIIMVRKECMLSADAVLTLCWLSRGGGGCKFICDIISLKVVCAAV